MIACLPKSLAAPYFDARQLRVALYLFSQPALMQSPTLLCGGMRKSRLNFLTDITGRFIFNVTARLPIYEVDFVRPLRSSQSAGGGTTSAGTICASFAAS